MRILNAAFNNDLNIMNEKTQRYFRDWVRYEGYGDFGYYLGARIVQFLLNYDSFGNIINYSLGIVKEKYNKLYDSNILGFIRIFSFYINIKRLLKVLNS